MAVTKQRGGSDMAVDSEGRPLPYSPAEVRKMLRQGIDDGDLVAVVVRLKGDLMVHVLGNPSRELLEVLEGAAKAYRRVLAGH